MLASLIFAGSKKGKRSAARAANLSCSAAIASFRPPPSAVHAVMRYRSLREQAKTPRSSEKHCLARKMASPNTRQDKIGKQELPATSPETRAAAETQA